MAKPQDEALNRKLEDIRRKLMATPTGEELRAMQLQMDALDQWARLSRYALDDHQHNHMDDHDNTKVFEPFVVLARSERTKA